MLLPAGTTVSPSACSPTFPLATRAGWSTPPPASRWLSTPDGARAEINVGASPFRRHYQGIRRKFVPYASLFVFYRREVSRLDRWRFSLYGGPGYSLRDYQEDNFKTMVGGPSASEGVCADFFLGRSVSFTSRHPEQTDRFLQVKLSCNQLFNAKQGKIVPSINLSAGLWFQSSDIKRK